MMKNLNVFQSKKLSTKIAVLMVGILIGLNILSTVSILFVVNHSLDSKENRFLYQTLANANNQVKDFVEKYSTLTDVLVNEQVVIDAIAYGNENPYISDGPDYPGLLAVMQGTENRYEDILGISFGNIKENFCWLLMFIIL